MSKSKLITLIASLNKKELQQCEAYISSYLYNKNEKLIQLFNIVKQDYPFETIQKINRPLVLKKLFPKQAKSDAYLRKLMAELSSLIEGFMTYLEFEENKWAKQYFLLENMSKRNLHDILSKKLDKYKNHQAQIPLQDMINSPQFPYYDYMIETIACRHSYYPDNRKQVINLTSVMDKMDVFYFTNKLQFCCEILNRADIVTSEYPIILLDEILEVVEKHKINKIPLINLYYIIIQLLKTNEEHYFFGLKQLLQEKEAFFSNKELRYTCIFCLNYCNRQYKNGKIVFLKEAFMLFKYMLNKELLMHLGYLSPHHFNNIVVTAVRAEEHQWAKKFIKQYTNKLQVQYHHNLVEYCLGIVAFYEQTYQDALVHFREVTKFPDFFYHLNNETLLIKTHYALSNYAFLNSKLDSLRMFVKRNKSLTTQDQTAYQNFINIGKRLLRIKHQEKKALLIPKLQSKISKAVLKLQVDIKETKLLIDKSWLLEQLKFILMHKII